MWEVFEKNYIITQPICKKPYATTYQNTSKILDYTKIITLSGIDTLQDAHIAENLWLCWARVCGANSNNQTGILVLPT